MSETKQIRVFSVDDHPLLHEGLATVIRHQSDMLMEAEAFNVREAIERFLEHNPDVTHMDLRLPDKTGIDAMIAIRSEFPEARVIMLTTFAGEVEIQRALEAGAHAFLLKTTPPKQMVEVIRDVHAGKKRIPPEVGAKPPNPNAQKLQEEREIKQPFRSKERTQEEEPSSPVTEGSPREWLANLFRKKWR